ncbi:MAG: biotin--[acetyl-CoA-carboxylase] ligase [Bacteroidales bacterium]|nr:biotin--[acetyl-CoA-carboxylase] ligase [Bacteroidales bacterium]
MKPRHSHMQICWHEVLDSTNSEVRRHLEDLDNLSVTAAVEQTAGRGRGGHRWASAPGENLMFSVLLKFGTPELAPLAAKDAVLITQAVTLALGDWLEAEGVSPRIKWPNDIWIGDRKICGILIENTVDAGNVTASIVGIGVNLNQTDFDPALPNPTSLSLLTGRKYDIKASLEDFCSVLEESLGKMNGMDGRNELASRFAVKMFYLEKDREEAMEAAIARYESLQ